MESYDTSNLSPIPDEQEWLLIRMEKIIKNLNKNGVCFGISAMGRNALLLSDLETFDTRLKYISNIPEESFNAVISDLNRKRLEIVKQVKKKIGPKTLTEDETKQLLADRNIQVKLADLVKVIDALITEGKLAPEFKTAEFERRKKMLLFNAFVQLKIEEKISQLPVEDRIQLDIPVFFEGLEATQQVSRYSHLFENDKVPSSRDSMGSFPLIAPQELENQGGIQKISEGSFSGIYDKRELSNYFLSLKIAIKAQKQPAIKEPIALVLKSGNHGITVGYDPEKDHWILIDANQLPSRHYQTNGLIAEKVLTAFSQNGLASFSTEFFVKQSSPTNTELRQCITNWKEQEAWKRMHTISDKKSRSTDSFGCTWLLLAAANGELNKVNELLSAHADPNLAMNNGLTALILAAQEGHNDIVNTLILANANVNAANTKGLTPLLAAVHGGHLEIVKKLISSHADPNVIFNNDASPLYFASQDGDLEMVRELLKGKADPNYPLKGGKSPLYVAAKFGHYEIIKELLAHGANPNHILDTGETALLSAVRYNQVEVVRELLKNNADPNKSVKKDGVTPLYSAVANGLLEIVAQLLAAKANPNPVMIEGDSPLFMAAECGHVDIVNALLKAGAKPDYAKKNGASALFIAAQEGHAEIVILLLEQSKKNITTPFTSSIESLREFAKFKNIESKMEDFISKKQKLLSRSISITPEEVARLMGHDKITTSLKQIRLTTTINTYIDDLRNEITQSKTSRISTPFSFYSKLQPRINQQKDTKLTMWEKISADLPNTQAITEYLKNLAPEEWKEFTAGTISNRTVSLLKDLGVYDDVNRAFTELNLVKKFSNN